jgi:hypothetical protein
MAFRAVMALDHMSDVFVGPVEEQLCLFSSTVTGDSSLCPFGQEDSRPCGFDES